MPFGWRSTRGVRVGGPLLPSARPLQPAADRPPRQVVVVVVSSRRSRRPRAVGPPPYSLQEVRLLFFDLAPSDGGDSRLFRRSRREGVERLAVSTSFSEAAGVQWRVRRLRRHLRPFALGELRRLLRLRGHARSVVHGDPRHFRHHFVSTSPHYRADDGLWPLLRRRGWKVTIHGALFSRMNTGRFTCDEKGK